MTVKELITILKEFPDDTPVIADNCAIQTVTYADDYCFGDPHDPYCIFGKAVVLD